jgi:hypothetical protein
MILVMFNSRILVIISCIALIVLSACGNQQSESTQHRAENGDLQETTSSVELLPSFLEGQSATIRKAYETAVTVKGLLPYIPCYCGCGASAGHQSNLNCFIREIKSDGTVVWDDHATRCGVCIETTFLTKQLNDQKVSLKDIRAYIDTKYAVGYAKPTNTPFPIN